MERVECSGGSHMSEEWAFALTALLVTSCVLALIFIMSNKKVKAWDQKVSQSLVERWQRAKSTAPEDSSPSPGIADVVLPVVAWIIGGALAIFVLLGIVGLLVFGIKQL